MFAQKNSEAVQDSLKEENTLNAFDNQQDTSQNKFQWKEKFFFGGGLDLAFDSYYALIGVSPSLGYKITPTTSIGAGVTYQLHSYHTDGVTTDVYGYRFFLMQRLISSFFAYAEYENLSYETDYNIEHSPRFWDDNKYAGVGWYKAVNKKTGFLIMGLYNFDLRGTQRSPFSFRMSFTLNPFER